MKNDEKFNTNEKNQTNFVLHELKSNIEFESISSFFFEKKKYEQNKFIKIINKFIECHDYAIVIKRFEYNRLNVKNKFYLNYIKKSKSRKFKKQNK